MLDNPRCACSTSEFLKQLRLLPLLIIIINAIYLDAQPCHSDVRSTDFLPVVENNCNIALTLVPDICDATGNYLYRIGECGKPYNPFSTVINPENFSSSGVSLPSNCLNGDTCFVQLSWYEDNNYAELRNSSCVMINTTLATIVSEQQIRFFQPGKLCIPMKLQCPQNSNETLLDAAPVPHFVVNGMEIILSGHNYAEFVNTSDTSDPCFIVDYTDHRDITFLEICSLIPDDLLCSSFCNTAESNRDIIRWMLVTSARLKLSEMRGKYP